MESTPRRQVNVITYSQDEWTMLKEQARMAMVSGFLPRHITKPEQAVIIAMKGRELGIPFMQAMASITVIGGKPALSAELMLALVYRNVPGAAINFMSSTATECEIEMVRPHGQPQRFKFSMEDAKRAGITTNPTWTKYPAAMLRARCISAGTRAVFPDAIMGCYTPEEMGVDDPHIDVEVETVTPLIADKQAQQDADPVVKQLTKDTSRVTERFKTK